MKKMISAGFSIVLALAIFLPVNYSTVTINDVSAKKVNVNDSCVRITSGGLKVNLCDDGLQQLDVSWNSGGLSWIL